MIDKDIAPWEPERFDQLETIGKWLMIYADAIEKWQFDFQDPASPIMEGIINLHHDLMFFLVIIAVFVLWVLLRTVYLFDRSRGHEPSKVVHGTVLEIVWTIVPSFILLAVAIPSFALLYAIDEASDPAITIKVIGHQWYWVYEYSDYTVDSSSLAFESFMVPEADLKLGQLRLLEVDNRIVVPTNTHIRFLITSADVLHSWAVPSLGVKVDAMPGRLNQATVFIKRDGVYYGQCSEICGVNHAFMPIVVESVPLDEYVSWVANQIEA
uniref:Cytochrome c oxidase subunit 2 n=1 Tax=Histiona aroides TaxID=392300 RepID=M4QD34_HISAR|nr:cytochrome c oxidase subunit II [Histiona aroides]AGH24100.1 cytochrome c oxidase subunit 2 [Histiona aroides]